MDIVLSRILHDDTLSKFRIRDMRPEETILVSCETVAEFNAARGNANQARRVMPPRPDGFQYKIETDSTRNTIKVSLYKNENGGESVESPIEKLS